MELNRNGFTGLDAGVAAEVRAEIARSRTVTVKGLSERLGIRRATLSDRVNGHAAFSPSLLAAVGEQLGVKASELVARAEHALAAEAVGGSSSRSGGQSNE